MFNRRSFLDGTFMATLLDHLKKRQYTVDFIAEVELLQKNIVKFYALQEKINNIRRDKNLLITEGLKSREKVMELNLTMEPLEKDLTFLEEEINKILPKIPNLLHQEVPEGINETHNMELYRVGEPIKKSTAHYDMGLIGNANELTGSRFVFLQGPMATLERALGNFLLNFLLTRNFQEVSVPLMLSRSSLERSGHIPKEEDNMFFIPDKNLYLIPTSECVLVNLMANTKIKEEDLPKKYTAFNSNFRKEAGAYGRDTKGLIRLHQFPKVEMVAFTKNEEDGMEMFREFIKHASDVLSLLGLPYRVINLSSGDLGFNASITYDLEVWMAGLGEYREISSISYCSTFQSENLKAKWTNTSGGEIKLLHSLNGTCVAVGRLLAAIMEYYFEDGYITIPQPLVAYTGFTRIKVI